jgi:hypothetical protein
MEDVGISIADAVDHLRAELAEAWRRGAGQSVQFTLGPVKVSLDVTVSRSQEAAGGVRFWVINADAGVGREKAQTQRVELEFSPVIDGRINPLIAAEHVEGS